MKTRLQAIGLTVLVSVLCAAPKAHAATIFTTGAQDAMVGRDWWSSPNSYWVDDVATVNAYHDGGNRWWHRGMIIFDIQSLHGVTLDPGGAILSMYSFGFSGVQLQYYGATSPTVTTAYGQASGSFIANLPGDEGWKTYDVTSFLQTNIDAQSDYVGFILNATVNYGGGSIAASEDSLGRGAYLTTIPEPGAFLLILSGIALMAFPHRSRPR